MFDFIQSSFKKHGNKDAVIWKNQVFSYTWLAERLEEWQSSEALKDITGGRVVILEADFSPNAVCLFLGVDIAH